MNQRYYCIADFYMDITFPREDFNDLTLSNYEPFLVSYKSDKLLFSISLQQADEVRSDNLGEEVGQFDSSGTNHGVYKTPAGGYTFVISDVHEKVCCTLEASPRFRQGIITLIGSDVEQTYGFNNAMMIMFAFASAYHQTLMVHASVVEKAGKGYLFLGKSGTGKSTHSRLWLEHIEGTALVNDDNPILRIKENGVYVYGSPWSGKTPCYRAVSYPAGAIVRLQQKKSNHIQRDAPLQGFASLLSSCSTMIWDKEIYHALCDTVSGVVTRIPTFLLGCLPDEEAARLSYRTVTQ